MSYGIPYRGSKNTIAKRIIDLLPRADTFVDLFAGGCAMTHCAIGSGKYRNFIANDIGDAPQLFANAIAGKYRDERRWISREDFIALKDSDPYIRLCWSFGNGGGQYLYSKEIEPWKRALHYARVFGDRGELLKFGIVSDGSYSDIVAHLDQYKEKYIRWYWENKMNTPAELVPQIEDTETEIAKTKEELRPTSASVRQDSRRQRWGADSARRCKGTTSGGRNGNFPPRSTTTVCVNLCH